MPALVSHELNFFLCLTVMLQVQVIGDFVGKIVKEIQI